MLLSGGRCGTLKRVFLAVLATVEENVLLEETLRMQDAKVYVFLKRVVWYFEEGGMLLLGWWCGTLERVFRAVLATVEENVLPEETLRMQDTKVYVFFVVCFYVSCITPRKKRVRLIQYFYIIQTARLLWVVRNNSIVSNQCSFGPRICITFCCML